MADTLKEFLVKLGFKVDDPTYNKFKEGVASATKAVEYLGTAAVLTDTAIGAMAYKAAQDLDKMYFAAGRLGSRVADVNSIRYGLSQLGSTSDAALASMESLGNFIRTYPGSAQFLETWGVAPEHVKDTALALKDLEHTFQGMTFWQAKPIAQVLGIDDTSLLAMQSGQLDKMLDSYNKRLEELGLNEDEAAKKSNTLMTEVRNLGQEFKFVGEMIVQNFYNPLLAVLGVAETLVRFFGNLANPQAMWQGTKNYFTNSAQFDKNYTEFMNKDMNRLFGKGAGVTAPTTGGTVGQALAYFKSQGWSDAQAAGIVANLQAESGFNTSSVGDNGQAYGIAQWHKDRRAAFKHWAGHDIYGSSLEEQMGFVNYELTKGGEQGAGNALRGATSARQAGGLVSDLYERPADRFGQATLRGDLADKISGGVNITQANTYNITGSDAHGIASAVGATQNDTNATLIRNMKGAIQ